MSTITRDKACIKCGCDEWVHRKPRNTYDCYPCKKLGMLNWYNKNRRSNKILKTDSEKKEYRKQYRQDNAKRIAKNRHLHYINNKETILLKSKAWGKVNKDKVKGYSHNNRIKNLEKYAYYEANRRSLKIQATPLWANKDYIRLFYLGAKIEMKRTGIKVHVDHIYPLNSKSVCGLHCEDNLQLLYAVDNLVKSNKVDI